MNLFSLKVFNLYRQENMCSFSFVPYNIYIVNSSVILKIFLVYLPRNSIYSFLLKTITGTGEFFSNK
jgi:hypothetical protein